MDLGLMCLSAYGHRRRQPLRRKMMTVFIANCVATVLVMVRVWHLPLEHVCILHALA